jgi:hypothetical protein
MSRTLFVYEKTLFVYAQPLHKVKQKSYLFLFYLTLLNSLRKFRNPSLIETESHYHPIGAYERFERFVNPLSSSKCQMNVPKKI